MFKRDGTTTAGNSSQVCCWQTSHCWQTVFAVVGCHSMRVQRAENVAGLAVFVAPVRLSTPHGSVAECSRRFFLDAAAAVLQVTDGASAVLLMTRREALSRGLPVLGIFRSFAAVGVDPAIMGVGPAVAIPAAVAQVCVCVLVFVSPHACMQAGMPACCAHACSFAAAGCFGA